MVNTNQKYGYRLIYIFNSIHLQVPLFGKIYWQLLVTATAHNAKSSMRYLLYEKQGKSSDLLHSRKLSNNSKVMWLTKVTIRNVEHFSSLKYTGIFTRQETTEILTKICNKGKPYWRTNWWCAERFSENGEWILQELLEITLQANLELGKSII